MTRKPSFWIILALLGLMGSVLAFRLFPVAFPILSVDIAMDRQGALEQAGAMAERFGWDPGGYRQAASFGHQNPAFQTYMELEGEGLDELMRLSREGVFSLYAWRVRHFLEGTIEEAEVRFTPQGDPFGFELRLSEDSPGEKLTQEDAIGVALTAATADWGMDPELWELLESSQEEQPGDRIDHTFVFERGGVVLGDARVRLRLRVAGDQLVEVSPFIHVPEAFLRRYQDTRNSNESIALLGTVTFFLLFLMVGGGVGTVHLLKNRLIDWKAPLLWGGVVAGLMALGQVNSLPLTWMEYDTALPSRIHVATLVLGATMTLVAGTGFLALLFMAGEGLMRLGFPDQLQQWKMWAPGVANSTPALGRTVGPYLVLGLKLAFVVVFYLATSHFLGWWSPASSLAEPDLLATHFPWLTAVSTSLFAAFSEETIFRAIPIGAAAVMGRRFGKPARWIWGAVILQALVFGASHANYPQQPAYARVVEIFPTYLAWGAVCVFFGLIPSIIAHYTYDLVFFSLSLFAADTPGIWLDRSMVIAAGILPLAIVLVARWRQGGVSVAPEWALNRSWNPPAGSATEKGTETGLTPSLEQEGPTDHLKAGPSAPEEAGIRKRGISSLGALALGLSAATGLTLWMTALQVGESHRLSLTRLQAEAEARSALEHQGVNLNPDWIPLSSVSGQKSLSHQFVWREGSPEIYEGMLGTFLNSPGWRVRFVNFDVAPEERAESFLVSFFGPDEPPRIRHDLPEGRSGGVLSEEDARGLALEALASRLSTDPESVREISAEEAVRPNRTDWTFTFAALESYGLAEGEGRLDVTIAGVEVVDARRFFHIPEKWERDWQAQGSKRGLFSLLSISILGLLGLGAIVLAIVLWTRGSLHTSPLRVLCGVMATFLLVAAINDWPATLETLTTQLSMGNQIGLAVLGSGLGVVFMAGIVGLLGSLGHTWIQGKTGSIPWPGLVGMALGATFVGFSSMLPRLGPSGPPSWPAYTGAVSYFPWLSTSLTTVTGFLASTAILLLVLATLERLRGNRWFWAAVPLTILIGFAIAPNPPGSNWGLWVGGALAVAACIGTLWVLCGRLGWAIVPGVVAAPVLMGAVETAVRQPFPGSSLGAVLGLAGVLAAANIWTRSL